MQKCGIFMFYLSKIYIASLVNTAFFVTLITRTNVVLFLEDLVVFCNQKHYIVDQGHMFCVLEHERSILATARLQTAYKDTTGMCLEVSYWLKLSSLLSILVRGVDYSEQELETKNFDEVHWEINTVAWRNFLCFFFNKKQTHWNHTHSIMITAISHWWSSNMKCVFCCNSMCKCNKEIYVDKCTHSFMEK